MLTKEEKYLIMKLKMVGPDFRDPSEIESEITQLIEIIERLESERPKIDSFSMEYRWLSNFYPCTVSLDEKLYPSTEHAYQAAKTLDQEERKRIAQTKEPGKAKRLGKQVTLRQNWTEEVRIAIMTDLLRQKFRTSFFRNKLIATGTMEIVEGNTWGDTFWGVCDGAGRNELGKIIMKIRKECVGES